MKLVSVQKMKDLEHQADQQGLSYSRMIANAGLSLAQVVHQRYFRRPSRRILGLVGSGNNGGDTLVALRHLADWGWQTQAYLVKERAANDELVESYLENGGEVFHAEEDKEFSNLQKLALRNNLILDGILGTGIKLPLKGEAKAALGKLKKIIGLPPVVAVDCPSGVDCENGKAADECLLAELTICMAAVKEGLLNQPALSLAGEILAVDIGLPAGLPAWQDGETEVADAAMAAKLLPARADEGYKGTFGTCLIAAGSINYCGAVLLAAQAAYKVGAGLVRAAIPGAIYDTLAGRFPEATWLLLPHTLGALNVEGAKIVRDNLERATCMLLGPGWGQADETLGFLKGLLEEEGTGSRKTSFGFETGEKKNRKQTGSHLPPLVIDADALKMLAKIGDWEKKVGTAVLTPHPGEMAILTGMDVEKIQADREKIAREYAQCSGKVVVLKGALTIIAAPDGEHAVIPVASSALAKAGTGDVLAGMITGLIAQGMEAYPAAILGAWLHARAGVAASKRIGTPASVTASDILASIPLVIKQIGG